MNNVMFKFGNLDEMNKKFERHVLPQTQEERHNMNSPRASKEIEFMT